VAKKKDNSNTWLKAEMRRAFLAEDARVLDLFLWTVKCIAEHTKAGHYVSRHDKASVHDVKSAL